MNHYDDFSKKRIVEIEVSEWLIEKGLPENIACIVAALFELGFINDQDERFLTRTSSERPELPEPSELSTIP